MVTVASNATMQGTDGPRIVKPEARKQTV